MKRQHGSILIINLCVHVCTCVIHNKETALQQKPATFSLWHGLWNEGSVYVKTPLRRGCNLTHPISALTQVACIQVAPIKFAWIIAGFFLAYFQFSKRSAGYLYAWKDISEILFLWSVCSEYCLNVRVQRESWRVTTDTYSGDTFIVRRRQARWLRSWSVYWRDIVTMTYFKSKETAKDGERTDGQTDGREEWRVIISNGNKMDRAWKALCSQ